MISRRFDSLEACKRSTIVLCIIFALWTSFIVYFGLFDRPPGSTGRVFVTEAKAYYFEKSSLEDKEREFKWSESLWLSLPNVSDVGVAGEVPGTDLDVLESSYVCYATIDGQTIDIRSSDHLAATQRRLYEAAINQISANVWGNIVQHLIKWSALWLLLLVSLIGRFIYLKTAIYK